MPEEHKMKSDYKFEIGEIVRPHRGLGRFNMTWKNDAVGVIMDRNIFENDEEIFLVKWSIPGVLISWWRGKKLARFKNKRK